jgi:hypothetical protein
MQVEDEHTRDASFSTVVEEEIVIANPLGRAQSMRKETWGGVDMDYAMKYYSNFRAMRV